jgi:hypothetical protein
MDRDSNYGDHWPERRNAALDRERKGRPRSGRDDRVALTEDDDNPDAGAT